MNAWADKARHAGITAPIKKAAVCGFFAAILWIAGLNPDCLHSLDMEQITASFLQAFARQLEQVQLLERLRHRQQVQRERQQVLRQLELVLELRQERVREQALLLFCHKR